jgi:hypothetical protein
MLSLWKFSVCCENVSWEGSRLIQTLYRIEYNGHTLQKFSRYDCLWTTAAQVTPTWDKPVTAVLNEEAFQQRMPSFRLTSKLLGYKNDVSINFDDSNKCWNGILAFSELWSFVPVRLGQIEHFNKRSEHSSTAKFCPAPDHSVFFPFGFLARKKYCPWTPFSRDVAPYDFVVVLQISITFKEGE